MAHFWGFGQVFSIFCILAKKATFEPISAPFEARNSRLASGSGSYHLNSSKILSLGTPTFLFQAFVWPKSKNFAELQAAGLQFSKIFRFGPKNVLTITILSLRIYPLST